MHIISEGQKFRVPLDECFWFSPSHEVMNTIVWRLDWNWRICFQPYSYSSWQNLFPCWVLERNPSFSSCGFLHLAAHSRAVHISQSVYSKIEKSAEKWGWPCMEHPNRSKSFYRGQSQKWHINISAILYSLEV